MTESIKFNSLCYSIPNAPFGTIGGNVCLISVREAKVSLGFIQGSGLPDPEGLLTGRAKAKRELPIRSAHDVKNPAVRDLLRASLAAAQAIARRTSQEPPGAP